ncbi:hypothetical protein EDB84DRAFT_1436692 [Lactarius hengduanensis]|nr:hypothetical protein EDB84DRAFT_1436692 [Lactarius hengduanensis]
MKEHTTAPDKQSKNAKGRRKRDAREQRNRDSRSRCEDPKLIISVKLLELPQSSNKSLYLTSSPKTSLLKRMASGTRPTTSTLRRLGREPTNLRHQLPVLHHIRNPQWNHLALPIMRTISSTQEKRQNSGDVFVLDSEEEDEGEVKRELSPSRRERSLASTQFGKETEAEVDLVVPTEEIWKKSRIGDSPNSPGDATTTRTVNGNVNIPTADVAGLGGHQSARRFVNGIPLPQRPPSHGGQYTATPHWLAANTESNSTGDSTALERPSLPECAYATAAGQLMLPMLYQMAIIVGAISLIHMGPYIVGAVEAWMRNENFSIAVGFNMTLQFYWGGGLIERDLTLFRAVIPRDQVVPAA